MSVEWSGMHVISCYCGRGVLVVTDMDKNVSCPMCKQEYQWETDGHGCSRLSIKLNSGEIRNLRIADYAGSKCLM